METTLSYPTDSQNLGNLCTFALNTFNICNSVIKQSYCFMFYKETVIVSLLVCSTCAFHLAIIKQVGWRGNVSNMYFVCARFEPQLRTWLMFPGFPHFLQTNAMLMFSIIPLKVPSTFFHFCYALWSNHSILYSLRYFHCP